MPRTTREVGFQNLGEEGADAGFGPVRGNLDLQPDLPAGGQVLAALQAAKRHDLALGCSPGAIDAEAHRDYRAARGIEGRPRIGGVRALAVLRASDLLAHTFPDVGPD
jgi:hypothetical protein